MQGSRRGVMNSIRILDWLGSAALTIAVVSLLMLFLPGVVRAVEVMPAGAVVDVETVQDFVVPTL